MINEKQKEVIIEVLGNWYSPKIIAHLSKKKIYNRKGNPFATDDIQKIVRGERPNSQIELEIAKLVASEKRKQKNAIATTKKLLK